MSSLEDQFNNRDTFREYLLNKQVEEHRKVIHEDVWDDSDRLVNEMKKLNRNVEVFGIIVSILLASILLGVLH